MTLEEAARAYRRAEKVLEERRADLAAAIVEAAASGRPQVEIVRISGYAREHVRRIVRAAESD
ncbi:MAG TPA: hypothetical protein VHX38_02435 [Pseudonocardiaceae bacterium]|jgi:hypothetical protein|nr:hypothetical protein [Pseudonocardiaceae bacterium]